MATGDLDRIEQLITEKRSFTGRLIDLGTELPADAGIYLASGLVLRTAIRDDNRSILGIHPPGDFLNLRELALGDEGARLTTAGPVTIGLFEPDALHQTMRDNGAIANAIRAAGYFEMAVQQKWIQMLQQSGAGQRLAHVICELRHRLGQVSEQPPRVLRTPFTQYDFADMIGVSAIHANRAVGKLKKEGFCEVRRGDVYCGDWPALERFAQFDPAYLYALPEPAIGLTPR